MSGETCMCADLRHEGNPSQVCGKVHGMLPSVINKWHECTGCGLIYCDDCGRTCLPGKAGLFDETRVCPSCGSRTILF